MFRVCTDDVDGELASWPASVEAALRSALAGDPWALDTAVGSNPTSGLRMGTFIADGRRFRHFVLIVDWDSRLDVLRVIDEGRL